ncbi:MAG TPA: circadian clock KaiB family protein [Verrucomicrobiae bacterium]|jgi:circadian clock protein KaiB
MAIKKKAAKPGKRPEPSSSTAEFEQLLKNAVAVEHYQLRLFVTGSSVRSTQAIENIRSLCEEYLHGRYDLEVVDIYQQPGEAADRQIIAAPTLIKELPIPPKRLIGNLADRDKVLVGLNLGKKSTATKWVKI